MDYREWGREYLREARMLKRHLAPLRLQLKTLTGEDKILLLNRIAMLTEMYLECLRTGQELLKKGDFFEARSKFKS